MDWLCCFLVCTWCVMPQAKAQANVVIVLDPGHGGSEAGATRSWNGKTYKEEVINQKIANYCKAELETYEGVTVYMTRTSVTQPSQDRETRLKYREKRETQMHWSSLHVFNSTGADAQSSSTGAVLAVYHPGASIRTARVRQQKKQERWPAPS